MVTPVQTAFGMLGRGLSRLDHVFDRLYGSRYNPLYQSVPIAVALFLVLLVTGIYLLFFYRIGAPYESVARIDDQVWTGRWIRSLHRYASDAAVIAIAVHGVRMLVRGRSWGARALAWVSGLVLTGIFLLIGWTGFVMVWDVQGEALAREGARFLDALPIFSEPISRTFAGEQPLPGAFFFLNYFLHIALPLGIALFLYLHVSRLARPKLLPPRRLTWALVAGLTALAVLWPADLAPRADPGIIPEAIPLNWFYNFWLPVTWRMPAWAVWLMGGGFTAIAFLAPLWTRPPKRHRPEASWVNERHCVGCEQCFFDCPYEAISMMPRTDGRDGLVAKVNPALCVSCGICSGSCAPMGVGPPDRRGRDQIDQVRSFLSERSPASDEIVLVVCGLGVGGRLNGEQFQGAWLYSLDCVGNLHTSVVEFMVRAGVGGVMIASCPERDCWNREGPAWTEERLFHGREAELKERVDRERVRYLNIGAADRGGLLVQLREFQDQARERAAADREEDIEIDTECEIPPHEEPDLKRGILP